MGACRFLNVLLGLSVAAFSTGGWGVLLALTVGVYIIGVTWFARTEARTSSQSMLTAAAGVMLAGVVLGLGVPALANDADAGVFTPSPFFPYLLVAFAFLVGMPVLSAINRPVPDKVQAAVKRAVLGLVLLDAVLATSLAGIIGLSLAALLAPSYYLGRWIYST
jgi:4-hydroxybenzoate polyprenyltransferase